MDKYFNEQEWSDIVKKPDWYFEILPKLEGMKREGEKNVPEGTRAYKQLLYGFFERHLQDDSIALGSLDGNWDAERMPIDTIVIHHTANLPGITKARLSAMELIRLYAPIYVDSDRPDSRHEYGLPISSGHIREGKQVFYPYHWLVRNDGTLEQHLFDHEIGWHAGNWDINCRSIAIVLDNNYETSRPSDIELEAIASLINDKYPHVSKDRIFGHCEVNLKKTCPSQLFLSTEANKGWKEDLLSCLR